MSETVSLGSSSVTAALQVVVELIRAGELKVGASGHEADAIIATHKQLTEHFMNIKKSGTISTPLR
ncbi:hypothetical protein ACFSVK_02380 [Azorhizophilus paspali]|uniref:Uncharacterized protein n=1 Tax=Azorhizophilus paspali TaxID=69963 RepID=A0ABV6SPR0_AZOPA